MDRNDRRRGLRVVFRAAVGVIAIGSATAAGSHAASEAASNGAGLRLAQFPGGPNTPGVGKQGIPGVPGLPNPNQVPNGKLPERQVPGKQLPPRELPDARLPSNELPYKQSEEEKQKEEDKERDEADELTRQLTDPSLKTQVRPPAQPPFPGTQTRDGDRGLTPPEEQPPIGLRPPPPTIFGEEIEGDNPCCGIVGNQIFYPFTKDPQEYKPVQFATNDKRTVGYNVMPHDGGFIETSTDIMLPSVGLDGSVTRTYRSDVKYEAGGLIGDGWDFNWNKRIVPIFTRITGTGLGVETIGADTALSYYDGTGHMDIYRSSHSENRTVSNFGDTYAQQKQFRAYVTTYQSPEHEFLEIERYIVFDPNDHPFKSHPDVKDELGESIFYVVRLKNGTRFVFNCRGQVIYIFDKHHNKVEFRYAGPMNPLTHSPVVSQMIDTANRTWSLKTTTIGEAPIATNFDCKFVSGVLPIPRVEEITDPAGRKLVVHYTFGGVPTIDWATREFPNDVGLSTDYSYDSSNRLTDIILPKEFSGQKRAFVHSDYDGDGRVVRQRHEAQTFSLSYSGGIDVTDSAGTRTRYELQDLKDTFVVSSISVTGGGVSSTNRYQHNPSHQITAEILPRGNRVEYLYDGGNEPVTLGRVRDWADRNLTYESNLSRGNLLGVRMVSDKPQARVVFRNGQLVQQSASGGQQEEILEAFSYEPLFNEKELFIDKRGNQTEYSYNYNLDYGHLGVPIRILPPSATQPGGGKVEVPAQVITYSLRGEPLTVTAGKRSVSNAYDARGWLTRRTREDGAATATQYRNDGQVVAVTMPGGYRITYDRNGRGLVQTSTLDPGPDGIRTLYRYDLHGNVLEMRKDVRDLFPANGAGALGLAPRDFGQTVTTYEFDQYDRQTKQVFRGYDGVTVETTRSYDANNRELSVTSPSPAGTGTVTRTYAYDALGRKISDSIAGRTTRFEHDANGNQTAEISPIGRRTAYFYDGFDRKIATADHAGGLMRQTLDKSGNVTEISFEGETGTGNARGLLQETKSDFDEYDKPIRVSRNSFVNGSAVTESYYDGNHDLVREKTQNGAFTRYEYDAMGRRIVRDDPLGNTTRYTYSNGGYLTSIEEAEKETTFATPGANPGQATRTYTTTITNDKFGNPISRGMRGGQMARTGYDSEGRVRVTIDETGRRTVNEYDSRGLLTAVIRDGETSRMTYNAGGLKVTATLPGGAMRWTYDQLGNELTATNTVSGQTTRKTYDDANQMVSVTDPAGTTLTYRYDTRGRLSEIVGRESYRYDGLGRVVQTGTIGREYDGLGNVVLERNYFSAALRGDISVRSEYAADGSQRTLRLPAIGNTPQATYVWRFDPLGRVTRVELNGESVANYLYSGANRVARVTYGDFTRAVYAFDAARRPTELQIWSDLARENLWSGSASYYGNTLISSREFYNPGLSRNARSQSMELTLDAQRRPAVKETRVVTRPDSSGVSQQVVTREFTDYDRVGHATQNISSIFINDTLTAVRSQRFTLSQGRISATETKLTEVSNGPVSVGFQRGNAEDYLSTPKYTETERFTYDGYGNVRDDDQFRYGFDHHGRLSSAMRRYSDIETNPENASYGYDNFGRLRSYSQYERVADRTFIYDGDNVIAEYRLTAGNPVLLARYVHGAGTGEIVRMDRRQDEDVTKPLKTYYIHEGLTGGYNFALSDGFRDPQIISHERSNGNLDNLIEGTRTRFPYISRNARYDPFTEFVYDEVRHTYTYSYTRAPLITWSQRREQWLAQVRAAAEETKRAQLAIMAIPLLPLAPMVPTAAWVGGGASLGLDYAMTSYVGGEYSFEQGVKAFGLGALGGSFGAALGAAPGVSGATRLGLEMSVDIAAGTVVDVASGGDFSESFQRNLLFSTVGGVSGKVGAAVATRYAKTPILSADLTKPISGGLQVAGKIVFEDAAAISAARAKADAKFSPSLIKPSQRVLIETVIKRQLMESNNFMDWMIGRMINGNLLNIELRQFQKSSTRGAFVPGGDTIYINERFFLDEYGKLLESPSAMVDMTSTVVHEGVHFLGGGEVTSHLAQGQYLGLMLKKNPKLALHPVSHQLAEAAGSDSIVHVLAVVGNKGYGLEPGIKNSANKPLTIESPNIQPIHEVVRQMGGFENLLDIKETSLHFLKSSVPAGHSF